MRILIGVLLLLSLSACKNANSDFVSGTKGSAGEHTPILRDSEGNQYGYYEYLPREFDKKESKNLPVIFYWNGINALTGNGQDEIDRLLIQGLTQYIDEGNHYSAIIISGMLPNWSEDDPHEFVEYIIKRYKKYIDINRVYMTGFSAGGGVTVKYAAEHPEHLAAILPVSPAVPYPSNDQPSLAMAKVPSWFYHNSGDMIVEVWHSNVWHNALKKLGGDHFITRPDENTHYAWKKAYADEKLWDWLLSKRRETTE